MKNSEVQKEELLKLVNELRQEVTCTICLDLFNDPVSLYCNHTFCKSCYTTLLRHAVNHNSVECPLCKKDTKRRDFAKNIQVQAVVTAVRAYSKILSNYCTHDDITEPTKVKSCEKKDTNQEKLPKKTDLEYISLPVKKTSSIRKARSLDSIATTDKNKWKRRSVGNENTKNDEPILIDEYESQNCFDSHYGTRNAINDRQIIDLMEEDCLAKLENEFLGCTSKFTERKQDVDNQINNSAKKNKILKKHDSSFKGSNKSCNSENSEAGWSRMKNTKKNVDKKSKKLKQLNISTFTTEDNKKENSYSTRSHHKENSKKKLNTGDEKISTKSVLHEKITKDENIKYLHSPKKLLQNRPVYKLDHFETYLQENLPKTTEDQRNKISKKTSIYKHCNLNSSVRKRDYDKKKEEEINDNKTDKQNNIISKTKNKIETITSGIDSKRLTRSCKKKKQNDDCMENISKTENDNPKLNSENIDQIQIYPEINNGYLCDKNKLVSISNDDDIFEISTQKLNKPVKNNIGTNINNAAEENDDNYIFEMCTQKLSEQVLDKPCFQNSIKSLEVICSEAIEEIKNTDLKKSQANSNEDLDFIKVWSPIVKPCSPKDDKPTNNLLVISNTEESDVIVKALVHRPATSNEQNKLQTILENTENTKNDLTKNQMDIVSSGNVKEDKSYLKCLEQLSVLQDDVIINNNLVKELFSFLSNSRSLFSSLSQGKNSDKNNIDQTILKQNTKFFLESYSVPNLSNEKEIVDFYHTAIPYLNNIRKLYNDFKLTVNNITTDTKKLLDVFGQNSNSINELLLNNEKYKNISSDLPTTISMNLENIMHPKINPKIDVSLQTETKIKCPKCAHNFDLNLKNLKELIHEHEFDFHSLDLTNQNFINHKENRTLKEIQNVSPMKEIENKLTKTRNSLGYKNETETNYKNKKINRQLSFENTNELERKYKRIRTQSSDSESDSGIQKKAKCLQTDEYMDLDIVFLTDTFEKDVTSVKNDNAHTDKPNKNEACQIENLLKKYKNVINNPHDKKNVTQDMTEKYKSLLEREYKELDVVKSKNLETIYSKEIERLNKSNNSVLNNISLEKINQTIPNVSFIETNSLCKKVESQFSKSLFTESDKLNNKVLINNQSNYKENQKNTSYEKEQFSMSMFTDNIDKNASVRQLNPKVPPKVIEDKNFLHLSPKDMFEEHQLDAEVEMHLSSHIIEDSLDSCNDIFDDENVVESTPQKEPHSKRKQNKTKANIDDLVNGLNEQANNLESDIDFVNTEWMHQIAPPPEFQDSTLDKTKDIYTEQQNITITEGTSLFPKYLSLNIESSSPQTLNKRIDDNGINSEHFVSFNDSNVNPNDLQRHNDSGCLKGSQPNDLSRHNISTSNLNLNTSDKNVSISARNNLIQENVKACAMKNLNPISLIQSDTTSPLTIIKSTNHLPKTVINSTPKQKSMFDFITPNKQKNERNSSSTSLRLTSCVQNKSMHSLDDKMEMSVKEKFSVPSPICITCTRLNREENAILLSLTTKYNLLYSKQFTNKVTHLVVVVDDKNCIKDHTMKYVSAIANGIWIVSFTWVQDCITHGQLLREDTYEVLDVSGIAGPKRSRLTRKTQPLFKNFVFYCADPFLSVTKHDLETVVTNLGAEMVTNLSNLKDVHCRKTGKICLILTEAKISQDFDQYQIWLEELKIITIDIEWLSRSVGQYQLASIRPFMLCLDEGIENFGYPSSLIAVVPDTLTEYTDTNTVRN